MGAFTFSFSKWPVVVCTATGELTRSQQEQHFKDYAKLLERGQEYVMVFDATKVGSVDPAFRKAYAEFLQQHATEFRKLCKGVAFVITSSVVRGLLTAILWVTSLPFPYTIVENFLAGEDWTKLQLEKQPTPGP